VLEAAHPKPFQPVSRQPVRYRHQEVFAAKDQVPLDYINNVEATTVGFLS
jgi:hypothetical protein